MDLPQLRPPERLLCGPGPTNVDPAVLDAMSRPISKIVKDETGTILGTWTTTYTGNGEVGKTTGARTAPADTVDRAYDAAGRISGCRCLGAPTASGISLKLC